MNLTRFLPNRLTIGSIAVGCTLGLSVAAGATGPFFDDSPSTPGDISGPCDEAEHANDPACAGVVVAPTPTAQSTPEATPEATPPAPVVVDVPIPPVTAQPGFVIDISGPCDEAEHVNDPECAGVVIPPASDGVPVGVDISGPCDEAEHVNDPRCTGAPAVDDNGNDVADVDDVDDMDDDNRGHGGDDDDDDDDNSGHGGDDDDHRGHGGDDDDDDDNSGHGGDDD